MLRQILGMAAMRRMGPMGKAMIAAQLGSMAYGMYKQRKARRNTRTTNARNGLGLDAAGAQPGFGPRAGANPLNPFG